MQEISKEKFRRSFNITLKYATCIFLCLFRVNYKINHSDMCMIHKKLNHKLTNLIGYRQEMPFISYANSRHSPLFAAQKFIRHYILEFQD